MLSKRRLGPWFLFGLMVLLAVISLRVVGVFLDYVLMGVLIGYVSYPLYKRIDGRIKKPSVSAALCLVLVVVVLVGPLVLLSVQLFSEVSEVATGLEVRDGEQIVDRGASALAGTFGIEPSASADVVQGIYDAGASFLKGQVSDLPGHAAAFLIGTFVMLYVVFYAYKDGPTFVNFIRDVMPMDDGHRDLLMHEVQSVTKGVLVGTFLTALIQAAIGAIGFFVVGIPNVLFWSVLMFVLGLLPVIGPPLVWAPWSFYLIMQGETVAGFGLLLYSAIFVSTIDNIIRPKLIGRAAHVHPVTVLLGALGGVVAFGFIGFVIGPLVLSIFVTILRVYRKEFMARDANDRQVWLK